MTLEMIATGKRLEMIECVVPEDKDDATKTKELWDTFARLQNLIVTSMMGEWHSVSFPCTFLSAPHPADPGGDRNRPPAT